MFYHCVAIFYHHVDAYNRYSNAYGPCCIAAHDGKGVGILGNYHHPRGNRYNSLYAFPDEAVYNDDPIHGLDDVLGVVKNNFGEILRPQCIIVCLMQNLHLLLSSITRNHLK